MSSLRKDSTVNRAAVARRRHRAPSTNRVHFLEEDEQYKTSPYTSDSTSAAATLHTTSLTSTAFENVPPLSSRAHHIATSEQVEHGGYSTDHHHTNNNNNSNALLERSFEVAEEAASVLASVRKQNPRLPPSFAGTRPSSSTTTNASLSDSKRNVDSTSRGTASSSSATPSSHYSTQQQQPHHQQQQSSRRQTQSDESKTTTSLTRQQAPVMNSGSAMKPQTERKISGLPILPSSSSSSQRTNGSSLTQRLRQDVSTTTTTTASATSTAEPDAPSASLRTPSLSQSLGGLSLKRTTVAATATRTTKMTASNKTASTTTAVASRSKYSLDQEDETKTNVVKESSKNTRESAKAHREIKSELQQQQQQQQQQQEQEQGEPANAHEETEEGRVVFAEDMEPIVRQPIIDAACLPHQSLVMLRSFVTIWPKTVQVASSCTDQETATALTTSSPHSKKKAQTVDNALTAGMGIGIPAETWNLVILESHLATRNKEHFVLCYGDIMALQSHTNNRFVGVRETDDRQHEVGCFRSVVGKSERWMILRSENGLIRVGRAAVEYAQENKSRGPTAPVQAGTPILLRHCKTGGILVAVVDKDDDIGNGSRTSWTLLLDSYDSNRVRHGYPSDPSLLGRLQRNDQLIPLPSETWSFLPAMVPPVPLWLHQNTRQERIFGENSLSYLLHTQRHDDHNVNDEFWDGRVAEWTGRELHTTMGHESILLDEILGSFLGLEGRFVRMEPQQQEERPLLSSRDAMFVLLKPQPNEDLPQMDRIVGYLIQDMLPLSTSYVRVREFVATHLFGYGYGTVMHAFCQVLERMLQEYASFVGSLETTYRRHDEGSLRTTLCGLQVQIQPTLHVFKFLEHAVEAVRCHKGGALLNALRSLQLQNYQGDGLAEGTLQQLLEAAARPYLGMLKAWLVEGTLEDPFSEFMVQVSTTNVAIWEDRYHICEEHVLDGFFTTQLTVDQVLATGRYWNAIQSCIRNRNKSHGTSSIESNEEKERESSSSVAPISLQYSDSSAVVATCVQINYQKASRALVELLLDEFDLVGTLRLVKKYFLLDHGDFFLHFLDAAEGELRKNLTNLSSGSIQHWLDASIQLTENQLEGGPHFSSPRLRSHRSLHLSPSDLRCRFAPESLTEHLDKLHAASGGIDTHEPWTPLRHAYGGLPGDELTGLDAFMVDFPSIPFPVSLVLSQRALACYQLLFRHLFFAKHVERRLVGIWQDHQGMKELQSLRGSMGPTFLLRQRMLHFAQNLIYYMMLEVIAPHWTEMEATIIAASEKKERTVDDILQVHMQFQQRILEACLLTNRDLVRALTKLMKTCLLFSDQMNLFMKATKIEDDKHNVATEKQNVVQRNLNSRRDSRRFSMDRKTLHKSMQNKRVERKQRIQRQTARVEREITGETYSRMISRFDDVFSDHLREFMAQLTHSDDLYHSQKVNLCIRLDYNGYVTRAMGLTTKV